MEVIIAGKLGKVRYDQSIQTYAQVSRILFQNNAFKVKVTLFTMKRTFPVRISGIEATTKEKKAEICWAPCARENSLTRGRFRTQTNSNSKLPQYIMAEKAVGLCIFITTPLLYNNNRTRWVCHTLGLVSGRCSHIVDKVVTSLW